MALLQRDASEHEDERRGGRKAEKRNNHYPKTCSIMS